MPKYKTIARLLDKKAVYFWENREDGIYALVNSFTLKTACGVRTRLDAVKLTESLKSNGYHVAKLAEMGDL